LGAGKWHDTKSGEIVIPILDLTAQYRNLQPEIDAAIGRVLESGTFILGPNVEEFESEIASYLGVRHAVALNSGTDALHLALRALNIGPGDEVITTPFTFIATGEAIGLVGARPVFVDIDPVTFNIDAGLIESFISPRTKAILPVHLYGCPADMAAIQKLAAKHGLAVIEDCAQAIGSQVGTQKCGGLGTIGCFSFFPTKNLGAYGDGGLASTNDAALADRLRVLRMHGGRKKYHHEEIGFNSRLDEIQAAILRVKLPHLDSWIAARRTVANRYGHMFKDNPRITRPADPGGRLHVFHQYTVRVSDRDNVRRRLANVGVEAMVYYPVPLHRQPVYKSQFGHTTYPHAELAAREVLSIPMFPELTPEAQGEVAQALDEATKMVAEV
jgi:dTDP-4-amino-4,6-dideoxygalactose transaminase